MIKNFVVLVSTVGNIFILVTHCLTCVALKIVLQHHRPEEPPFPYAFHPAHYSSLITPRLDNLLTSFSCLRTCLMLGWLPLCPILSLTFPSPYFLLLFLLLYIKVSTLLNPRHLPLFNVPPAPPLPFPPSTPVSRP